MNTRWLLRLAAVALVWVSVRGLAQDVAGIEALRASYDQALAKLDEESDRNAKGWPGTYVAELKELQAKAQKAGDLEGWKAIADEVGRFEKERVLPAAISDGVPSALRAAIQQYRQRTEQLPLDKNRRIVSLSQTYIARLEALQKQLTVANRIVDALRVNEEIKRVRTSPVLTSASFLVADYESRQSKPAAGAVRALPVLYENRTPEGQAKALQKYRGSRESQAAVDRALRWLKGCQSPDGSWPGSKATGLTGLALLAYFGHGETPASQEFGPAIKAAVDYLVGRQQENGLYEPDVYAHGIATYAMCEGVALAPTDRARASAEKAVAAIIAGQQPDGAYTYGYGKGRWDTSASVWQYQALKAAQAEGLSTPGIDAALRRAMTFLRTEAYVRRGGGFGYAGQPGAAATAPTWTMTAAATFCLQLLGQSWNTQEILTGTRFVHDHKLRWPTDGKEKATVYGWYYLTYANFLTGGAAWDDWNREFSKGLLAGQKPDGHWENGDHDPGTGLYTTALATLMLESYYRYSPRAIASR